MKKQENNSFYKKYLLTINILLVVVIVILCLSFLREETKSNRFFIERDNNDNYPLTNPILDCENGYSGEELAVQSRVINEKVSELKSAYSLSHISLYFRDMNNGPWIGINEKEEFSPASLLKVPIMIAFLREVENNFSLLDEKIEIQESDLNKNLTPNIVFDNLLEVGNTYTMKEIVESMIQKSDNTGVIVLLKNIKINYLKEVFDSVGVPFKDTTTEVPVRVKDYAGFFRVLYNSSYLSREMSEKALEILSKSEYMSGIRKGVPSEIVIAHKFGERAMGVGKEDVQLHDCGIVYYPEKPYLLCIMTRGNNFKNQEKVIEELSSLIYKEVHNTGKKD